MQQQRIFLQSRGEEERDGERERERAIALRWHQLICGNLVNSHTHTCIATRGEEEGQEEGAEASITGKRKRKRQEQNTHMCDSTFDTTQSTIVHEKEERGEACFVHSIQEVASAASSPLGAYFTCM